MYRMNNWLDFLFGPLDKTYYCNFFLVCTIFAFVFLLGALFILGYNIFNNTGSVRFYNAIMIVVFYSILYLQCRILYSICLGSI